MAWCAVSCSLAPAAGALAPYGEHVPPKLHGLGRDSPPPRKLSTDGAQQSVPCSFLDRRGRLPQIYSVHCLTRNILPISPAVCTENLTPEVVLMKSAQDGK